MTAPDNIRTAQHYRLGCDMPDGPAAGPGAADIVELTGCINRIPDAFTLTIRMIRHQYEPCKRRGDSRG